MLNHNIHAQDPAKTVPLNVDAESIVTLESVRELILQHEGRAVELLFAGQEMEVVAIVPSKYSVGYPLPI